MSALESRLLTPEEYLEIERVAEVKSEFFDGRMRMMAGAGLRHNNLVHRLSRRLGEALDDTDCETVTSDQRVLVEATGLYTYPDAVIYCGEASLSGEKPDTLLNPIVLFEVLSPTTADYDQGAKWVHYQQIVSLTDYVLVWQDKVQLAHYARQTPDCWTLTIHRESAAILSIAAPAVTLPLSAIYAGVTME